MPEESNEDGLVPPLKVMRKRLNGVYRADGFSGPTRRYVLIVALLVGLASLPTLAAITAGSHQIDEDTTGAMDVPFLPPPSAGAVIPVPILPDPGPSSPSGPAAGNVRGQAGERQTMPKLSYGHSTAPPPTGPPPTGPSPTGPSPTGSDRLGDPPRRSAPRGADHSGSSGSGSSGSGSSGDSSSSGGEPSSEDSTPHGHPVRPPTKPSEPTDPENTPNAPEDHPFCHERGTCGCRESRHHRPDWSRHRHCEDATHRAHWSHHRKGRTRNVAVRIAPTGRHGHRATVREHPATVREHPAKQMFRSIVSSHRSSDRSEPSRRSTVTERQQNGRTASTLERTHNSRRHQAEFPSDETPTPTRTYRGSHRAQSLHRADDTFAAAHDRSSRVGRHHAEQHRDHTSRW